MAAPAGDRTYRLQPATDAGNGFDGTRAYCVAKLVSGAESTDLATLKGHIVVQREKPSTTRMSYRARQVAAAKAAAAAAKGLPPPIAPGRAPAADASSSPADGAMDVDGNTAAPINRVKRIKQRVLNFKPTDPMKRQQMFQVRRPPTSGVSHGLPKSNLSCHRAC